MRIKGNLKRNGKERSTRIRGQAPLAEKSQLKESLRMQRKAWYAIDNHKGLKKLSMQAMAMNLKNLANRTWKLA